MTNALYQNTCGDVQCCRNIFECNQQYFEGISGFYCQIGGNVGPMTGCEKLFV